MINHRSYAQFGLMHTSFVKHMKMGQHHDFYDSNGDKQTGKVLLKTPTKIHMQHPNGRIQKFDITDVATETLSEGGPTPNLKKHVDPDEDTKFVGPLVRRIMRGLKRMKRSASVKGLSPYNVARILREEYSAEYLMTITEDRFDEIIERYYYK